VDTQKRPPSSSVQYPTAVVTLSSACVVHVVIGLWLSFHLWEAEQIGKFLERDRIGHLEAKLEITGHGIRQLLQIFPPGEIVIGGVHANRFEHFGILGQAIALKTGLGEFAPMKVPVPVIELIQPAFIFPTGRANEHPCAASSAPLILICSRSKAIRKTGLLTKLSQLEVKRGLESALVVGTSEAISD
jgi:hypothetical protein